MVATTETYKRFFKGIICIKDKISLLPSNLINGIGFKNFTSCNSALCPYP